MEGDRPERVRTGRLPRSGDACVFLQHDVAAPTHRDPSAVDAFGPYDLADELRDPFHTTVHVHLSSLTAEDPMGRSSVRTPFRASDHMPIRSPRP